MKKLVITLLLILLFVTILGLGVYLFRSNQLNNSIFGSKSVSNDVIVKQLAKHMLLPQGSPTIGKVTDIEKLKQKSSFFNSAKNGDIVLIYEDKAIIYDVVSDKIINVGAIPAKINNEGSSPSADLAK